MTYLSVFFNVSLTNNVSSMKGTPTILINSYTDSENIYIVRGLNNWASVVPLHSQMEQNVILSLPLHS